jgi:hypothetical protein
VFEAGARITGFELWVYRSVSVGDGSSPGNATLADARKPSGVPAASR